MSVENVEGDVFCCVPKGLPWKQKRDYKENIKGLVGLVFF